jgi:benzoate-CoA ligase family protein
MSMPVARIADPVADDVAGAREIKFSLPEQYNASRILFDNLGNGNAARVAVRSPRGDWSYSELCRAAARAGNALLSVGLAPGERVLFFLNDDPAYAAFVFGAIRAGLVPVLTNTLTPPGLIAFYLSDAQARVVVIDAALAGQLTPEALAATAVETVIVVNGVGDLPHARRVLAYDRESKRYPDWLAEAETTRDEMAFWMYSSGSTGRPKGIVHLQHDMAYTAASYAAHVLRLRPDDICFSVPKIFFAYGFGNSLTFPFAAGASSVLFPGRPDPTAVFGVIKQFRPTVFFGVPTAYTSLVKAPEAGSCDLSSLRLCVSAAEVLAGELSAAWKKLSGLQIVEGLGSTEMLHIYLSNTEATTRTGASGLRVPGYEVKLVDPEGRELGDGDEGVMWVRGHSSAPLYWNRPDKTGETMRGDWICTGDRFMRDGDGFFYFQGRADDLIKVSGQWVYPMEVELCLANHPEVRECCVLGVQLADRRTTLKAFVVPLGVAGDPDALKGRLQEYAKKTLMPYKYPRIVELLPELPKTGTGKIDRQALAERGVS